MIESTLMIVTFVRISVTKWVWTIHDCMIVIAMSVSLKLFTSEKFLLILMANDVKFDVCGVSKHETI